ncbi:cell division protein FtsK, partial [Roseomonas eburnea]
MPRAALTDDSRSTARSAGGGGRFASAAVRAVLRRRVMELCGLLVALLGVALLVALGSHNPADPSLNTATDRPVGNLAGPAGAVISDILLQGFGFAGALPGVALLAWAFRLATHRGLGSMAARLGGLVVGLPLAAAAVSLLPMPAGVPVEAGPGGAIGPVLAGAAVDGMSAVLGPLGALVAHGVIAVAAVGAVFIACGLTVGEWRGAGRAAVGAGQVAVVAARSGAAVLRRPASEPDPPPARPQRPGLFARLSGRV